MYGPYVRVVRIGHSYIRPGRLGEILRWFVHRKMVTHPCICRGGRKLNPRSSSRESNALTTRLTGHLENRCFYATGVRISRRKWRSRPRGAVLDFLNFGFQDWPSQQWLSSSKLLIDELICSPKQQLECGPMPNVMAALPNIGGALCESSVIPFLVPRRSLVDAHFFSAVQ